MCWAWLLLKVRLRQSRVNASSLLWSLFIRITRPQLFDHLVCRRCHPINDCTVMMGQLSGMKIPLFAFGRLGNHCAHESVCPSLHSRATQLRRTGASSTLNRRRGVRKGRGRASSQISNSFFVLSVWISVTQKAAWAHDGSLCSSRRSG